MNKRNIIIAAASAFLVATPLVVYAAVDTNEQPGRSASIYLENAGPSGPSVGFYSNETGYGNLYMRSTATGCTIRILTNLKMNQHTVIKHPISDRRCGAKGAKVDKVVFITSKLKLGDGANIDDSKESITMIDGTLHKLAPGDWAASQVSLKK